MQRHTRDRIIQLLLGITVWVVLPLHCLLHCDQHRASDNHGHQYVCTMTEGPQVASTSALVPHPYVPHALHEAITATAVLFGIAAVFSAHMSTVSAIVSQRHRPDVPPPRLSSYGFAG